MFRLIAVVLCLGTINSLYAEVDLVKELSKLNVSSKQYLKECEEFNVAALKIEAFDYDSSEDPKFKSKKLALEKFEYIIKKAPLFPEEQIKAWHLLWNSKEHLPAGDRFLKEMDKVQTECDILSKNEFFVVYAYDHQSLNLSTAEKKFIMDEFKKFMHPRLQKGAPAMSALVRISNLRMLVEHGLLGGSQDIKKSIELNNSAETENMKFSRKVNEKNYFRNLKGILEFTNKYFEKLAVLTTQMGI